MPPRSTDHKKLGRAFRQIRQEKGLTQAQLAKRSGLPPTYISDIERGVRNPSYQALTELAQALGVRLSAVIQAAETRSR